MANAITLGGELFPILNNYNTDSLWNFSRSSRGHQRMGRGLRVRDYKERPVGYGASMRKFTSDMYIPREEWPDRCQDLLRGQSLLRINQLYKFNTKNQQHTNYCWGNAPARAAEYLYAFLGHGYIDLSPASVCAPATGYRNNGGWPDKWIEHAAQYGIAPSAVWPPNAINRGLAQGAATIRQSFKIEEWFDIEPGDFDAMFSMLLRVHSAAICLNWWGHAIDAMLPVWLGGRNFGTVIDNSHGKDWANRGMAVLTERVATPDGCLIPLSTSVPDPASVSEYFTAA